jgi:hypothetical protein
MREPFEPLTITTSPGPTSRDARAASASAVACHSPRRPGGSARCSAAIRGPAQCTTATASSAGRSGQRRMHGLLVRPELQHVAEEGDPPAPTGPMLRAGGSVAAKTSSAAAIAAGFAL